MLRCEFQDSHLYPTLVLALRDMREACGRDPTTGAGQGGRSWIGLTLAMIVLDTLSGDAKPVWMRWRRLLTGQRVSEDDCLIIYALRCSLLHGYGPPKPGDAKDSGNRRVLLTDDSAGYALDTAEHGLALLSVPVFCGYLVERIVSATSSSWDGSLVDTEIVLPR